MTLTTRFLALLPGDRGVLSDPGVAVPLGAWAERKGLHALAADPCFLFADASPPAPAPGASLTVWNIDAGKRAGARARRSPPGDLSDWAAIHADAGARFEIYNVMRVTPEGFRLEGDRLGLKPVFWAACPEGILLANRLLDLLNLRPALAHPIDDMALYEYLSFGFPLANRTLHRSVARLAPGAVLRWKPGHPLSLARERRIHVPPPRSGLGIADAADEIARATQESVARRCAGLDTVAIAVTGGFDSRFLLGVCQSLGLPCKAITYGNALHHELVVAKRIARRAGVPHTIYPFSPTTVRDRLAVNLQEIEATADYIFALCNLLQPAEAPGGIMLNGFIFGAMGGHNMAPWTNGKTIRSHDDALDMIAARHRLLAPDDVAACIGLRIDDRSVRDDLAGEVDMSVEPYQSLMLWDVEGRQRRYNGGHFRVLGTQWDMCLPGLDDRLCGLYLSLPRTMLEGRAITRRIVQQVYPRFAGIRHAEERMPLVPGPWDHARAAVDGLLARLPALPSLPPLPGVWRLKRWLPPHAGARLGSMRAIWNVASYQLLRDRPLLLARMEEQFPAFARLFPAPGAQFDPGSLMRLPPRPFSRFLFLYDYAAALGRRIDRAGAP